MHPETAQSQKPDTGWRLRTLFLSLVVTGCIITSLWFATKPKEPMYKGQPFSYWLSRIDETGATLAKHANATECRDAIRAMGTNALSAIIRILNAKDSAFKEKLIDLADRQDMVRVPFHTVEDEKAKAAAALYILGDIATNALPALIDICRHPSSPSSQQIAENTLMRLYPAKGVADPYWEPSERRAQWYIGAGMIQLQSDTASTSSNALLAFSRAIDLEPTNMSALLQRGHTRLQLDQFTNALADFSKIFELSPTNDNAIYGRALCRYGLKDYRGAAAECTKVINWDTNHFQAVNLRGLSRANLRDFKAAQEDFTTALAISSYEPSYYRNRGAVESIQTEYEAALDDVSQSLELDKKDAAAWALRSRILCALKDYHGAITNADIAVQLDPKSAHVYTCRATARMCLKEFDAASHDLDTALRLDSKHANAYLIRGIMTAKRGDADDAALADLERAVELAPTAPDTFGLLGLFQYKISKWARPWRTAARHLNGRDPQHIQLQLLHLAHLRAIRPTASGQWRTRELFKNSRLHKNQ